MNSPVNAAWYINRLQKMSAAEILKRLRESFNVKRSRIVYNRIKNEPYSRFSDKMDLVFHDLPGFSIPYDIKHFSVYNKIFDLTDPLDWHFSEFQGVRWPDSHFSLINYRPGNPYGDVRINWELNRLQFLPIIAAIDENLASRILADWLVKNPFMSGPAYLASMEVALRWISIYWASCLFSKETRTPLERNLAGLAVASAKFIQTRLSTHSSAGNHLIVEAVGLFWIGCALERHEFGFRVKDKARTILREQVPRQLNPDGTNQEQCFWYLGFVLDALFHYILLENPSEVPPVVLQRIEQGLEFMNNAVSEDGRFPDYGDRDDGFVFRPETSYNRSPFPGLVHLGSHFVNRPDLVTNCLVPDNRVVFWGRVNKSKTAEARKQISGCRDLKTYEQGGMSLMTWGKGRLLFRHSRLGLDNTCGHGHADALSVLFTWNNAPVLIDLGSGQYNGNQDIRNFFRSTIAHNTIEIGGKSQSVMLGTFMWDRSYNTRLIASGEEPQLHVEASHDGYVKRFGTVHSRRVTWPIPTRIEIVDSLEGPGGFPVRGAFHLGNCHRLRLDGKRAVATFEGFEASFLFPEQYALHSYKGSNTPFMGWRSTVYGRWEPTCTIIFSTQATENHTHSLIIEISDTIEKAIEAD